MAFFRFSRDKRGYQHFYLVEPIANRRGKVRQRVLYWFRSPPDIKVGREPFDEDVRRALEQQNPDVTFDWRTILEAPIPSADAEKWRERRRAERAARQATRSADGRSEPAVDEDEDQEGQDEAASAVDEQPAQMAAVDPPTVRAESSPARDAARRKRRRRRGRRSDVTTPQAEAASIESAAGRESSGEPFADEGDAPDTSSEE